MLKTTDKDNVLIQYYMMVEIEMTILHEDVL